MVYLTPTTNLLTKLIRTVGKKLVRDFSEIEKLQSSIRGTNQFAKKTKEKIKKELFFSLKEIKPDYNFLIDGLDQIKKNSNFTWIINPLSGYTNFLHSIPHFCISVAIIENFEIISSVVYDPIKDEIFYAAKGKGAYLNDSRLRVSNRSLPSQSIIFLDSKFNNDHKSKENKVISEFKTTRKTGCSDLDLCYVASGRSEVFYKCSVVKTFISAGLLIVKEAGGLVEEFYNNKQNNYFVSNRLCHDYIKKFLK